MDPRIRVVAKIIEEQPKDVPRTLEMASRSLGLSQAYLHRLFKQNVGMSMAEYVQRARMNLAATLLRECNRPIKLIAFDCGYTEVSNFYRDFKKVHGLTPRELRIDQVLMDAQSRE